MNDAAGRRVVAAVLVYSCKLELLRCLRNEMHAVIVCQLLQTLKCEQAGAHYDMEEVVV